MRLLRRPEFRLAALLAIALAAWLTVRHSQSPEAPAVRATPVSWLGLVNPARPAVDTSGRFIVVLRTPSVAAHVAAGELAGEQAERRWTAEAYAAQQQVLIQLARHGFSVRPDYSYSRVLDGFSADFDARAIALLERNPEVTGVYPVRIAYPAAISASPRVGIGPGVGLPRVDGTGLTIALLDTGVDLTHPYLAGRVEPGYDIVGGTPTAAAQTNPQSRTQLERHGTELAGVLVGSGGPRGLHGVAPGASVVPIRVAGWQEAAGGRDAVFARSDQLIAGLDRAVDPNGDGDAHDALRIALIGVAEPFASFADSPEAEAVSGALALDTLVVVPAGNDGVAGPLFGSVAGPGGSPSALVVGAIDSRPSTSSVRVVFHQGITVLEDTTLPLLGASGPARPLRLGLAVPGAPGALDGKAALLPAGKAPAATIRAAVAGGARAVLLYGRALPAGALTGVSVPVVGVPEKTAAPILAAVRRHFLVEVALGRVATVVNRDAGRTATFSSRGLTLGGLIAPQVSAPGVGIETSDAGSSTGDAAPAFVSVTGTSVAAAATAGSAALLAAARPGLSAADLASLLTGSSQPSGAAPAAGGAAAVDPVASAAGEVAASATALSFGPWTGPAWKQARTVTVHDVSSRRLAVTLTSSSRLLTVEPATLSLEPGGSAAGRVTARAAKRPALAVVGGTIVVRPAGGRALRIPWGIIFRPYTGPLLGPAVISPLRFSPSDSNPASLNVVAGRISGGAIIEVEPVARLDVLLYSSGGAFLGVLASVPDLLPGSYSFALTGRTPGGAVLPAGSYEIRLVAHPTLGGAPTRRKIAFRIE